MLYLKEANLQDAKAEYAFVREIPADENGFTSKWHGCDWDTFMEKALPEMLDYAVGKNLPEGFVPETFYFLWNDDVLVGEFRIRHYLCDSLRTGAGHIGYYIGKEFRGKGYAKEGLRLTLLKAKEIVPEEEIYLRVNKNNPASLRVQLHNGGCIQGEDEDKYYVRIRKDGIAEEGML